MGPLHHAKLWEGGEPKSMWWSQSLCPTGFVLAPVPVRPFGSSNLLGLGGLGLGVDNKVVFIFMYMPNHNLITKLRSRHHTDLNVD